MHLSSACTWLIIPSDYYASLLRTRQDLVAPTQGALINYVQRVPLGVVAQITVCVQVVVAFATADDVK